jgi:hypothetical protein
MFFLTFKLRSAINKEYLKVKLVKNKLFLKTKNIYSADLNDRTTISFSRPFVNILT